MRIGAPKRKPARPRARMLPLRKGSVPPSPGSRADGGLRNARRRLPFNPWILLDRSHPWLRKADVHGGRIVAVALIGGGAVVVAAL